MNITVKTQFLLVPTLCVGTLAVTLCAEFDGTRSVREPVPDNVYVSHSDADGDAGCHRRIYSSFAAHPLLPRNGYASDLDPGKNGVAEVDALL